MCSLSCGYVSAHWGKYQGAQLLDLMVRVCLVFIRNHKVSYKAAIPFAFPPAVNLSSCASTSSWAFGGISVFAFGRSVGHDIWTWPVFDQQRTLQHSQKFYDYFNTTEQILGETEDSSPPMKKMKWDLHSTHSTNRTYNDCWRTLCVQIKT